jgi:photosystem II stability/assembly factor-like uncharacterized protein
MKKFIAILTVVISINYSVFVLEAEAQWSWIYPLPQNNNLVDISFCNSSNGMAVGQFGAIVFTTNSGLTWTNKNYNASYSADYGFQTCFMINSSTGFAAGELGLIVKTTNAGTNWIPTSVPNYYSAKKIFFVNENTGWFLNNNFLYKTTDCGTNWIKQPVISATTYINTLFFINELTGFAAGTPSGGSIFKMFKTVNGGLRWDRIFFTINTSIQSLYFVDSLNGYAGGTNGVLAKTTDCGNSWEQLNVTNNYGSILSISFANQNTGYVNFSNDTINKILKTTNAGLNFNLAFVDSTVVLSSVSAYGNAVSTCGSYGRLASSSDYGNNWISNSGEIKGDFYPIAFQDEFNFIAMGRSNSRIKMYRTTNGGYNWLNYASPVQLFAFYDIYFVDILTGFAVGEGSTQSGKTMRTTDGGVSWTQLPTVDPYKTLYTVHFLNANTGLTAGMQGLIARTTNAGNNWTIVHSGGPHLHDVAKFINENTAYSINSNGDVFRSTNGGVNWFTTANISPGIHYIQFLNENTGYLGGPSGIYKTTNGGYNWVNAKSGINCGYLEFYDANTGFASGYNAKCFRTTNGGNNWIDESGFNHSMIILYHFFTPDIVYAYGNRWLMKTTNGGTILPVNETNNEIVNKYSLGQNYPNPFNPTTNVKFSILNSGDVKLVVYDIMGREVQTLVNEMLKPGTYEVKFDGSMLTSGVYFYKLITDGFSETKRMLLIK